MAKKDPITGRLVHSRPRLEDPKVFATYVALLAWMAWLGAAWYAILGMVGWIAFLWAADYINDLMLTGGAGAMSDQEKLLKEVRKHRQKLRDSRKNNTEVKELRQYLAEAKVAVATVRADGALQEVRVKVSSPVPAFDDLFDLCKSDISILPFGSPSQSATGFSRTRERAPHMHPPTTEIEEEAVSEGQPDDLLESEVEEVLARLLFAAIQEVQFDLEPVEDTHPKALLQALGFSNPARAVRILRQPTVPGLNQVYSSGSILNRAVGLNFPEVVEALLARPDFRQVNARNVVTEMSALHSAAVRGQMVSCRAILHRQDFVLLRARSCTGRTAREEALNAGHRAVAEFLRAAEVALQ